MISKFIILITTLLPLSCTITHYVNPNEIHSYSGESFHAFQHKNVRVYIPKLTFVLWDSINGIKKYNDCVKDVGFLFRNGFLTGETLLSKINHSPSLDTITVKKQVFHSNFENDLCEFRGATIIICSYKILVDSTAKKNLVLKLNLDITECDLCADYDRFYEIRIKSKVDYEENWTNFIKNNEKIDVEYMGSFF